MKFSLVPLVVLVVLAIHRSAAEEWRTALVVGCDYHDTALHLPSPVHDAEALAKVLESQMGFEVTSLINPGRKDLLLAIDRFGETLGEHGGVGLFYFSGRGAQNEGENFLIPMGTSLGYSEDLPTEAVSAQRVITRMEEAGNRVNLLFLDACRNNPLPSAKKKGVFLPGLTALNAAGGMLIGFAAARNTAASDTAEGSLYTNALLKHITTRGLSVTDMLTRVNAEVRKTSGGTQIPFMEVGLNDAFVFNQNGGGAAMEWTLFNIEGRDYVPLENVASFYGLGHVVYTDKIATLERGVRSLIFGLNSSVLFINKVKAMLCFPIIAHDGQWAISRMDLTKVLEPALRPNKIRESEKIDTVILDPAAGGQDAGVVSKLGTEKTLWT